MTVRRWLVTGASSGFGLAIAKEILARGDVVIGTSRRPEHLAAFAELEPGRSIPLQLDVTDDQAVAEEIPGAIERAGGLDVLVNNAGYSLVGSTEDTTIQEARFQMETNFFGMFKVTQAVLPRFRRQGGGRVINIASCAAAMGFALHPAYAASKHAIAGFSESLAREVATFNIKVTCVEPGGFRTDLGVNTVAVKTVSEPYAKAMDGLLHHMANFSRFAANDPGKGAKAIASLADLPDPPLHFALGADGLAMITGALEGRLAEYARLSELGSNTACPDQVEFAAWDTALGGKRWSNAKVEPQG